MMGPNGLVIPDWALPWLVEALRAQRNLWDAITDPVWAAFLWLLTLPVDGEIYAALFGIKAAACLVFGTHAIITAIIRKRRGGPRIRNSVAFWIGMVLATDMFVTAGTFALFFAFDMARLTGIGLLIYGPGTVVTTRAYMVWTRTGGPPK